MLITLLKNLMTVCIIVMLKENRVLLTQIKLIDILSDLDFALNGKCFKGEEYWYDLYC